MAKKKIELFIDIKNEREFEIVIDNNKNMLICADVFNIFAGPCTVLDHLFLRIKMDWGDGKIVLLKVPADEITALERFRNQSQPVFIFILNRKITKIFRGVDNIQFAEVAKKELDYFKRIQQGEIIDRPVYDFNQASPEEQAWLDRREADQKQEIEYAAKRRAIRQESRKWHRAELMVPKLEQLNFVLFWPHSKHAHPELYERWDLNNIIMIGREEVQLSQALGEDILYAGDAPINEASMHALLSGTALAICFRILDTDKHFVTLVRKILYEDLPDIEDGNNSKGQVRQTAFDYYKTYTLNREEVMRQREQAKIKKKELFQEEIIERRARRLSEMQRLARQAIEDAAEAYRTEKEKRRLALLKSGNLEALEELKNEIQPETDIIIPEVLAEDVEEEVISEDDESQYLPPAGLLVPGFYAPPNDIAKANGLDVLFHNLVIQYVVPEPEYLPPHVLVMLDVSKRYAALDVIAKYKKDILHMGFFRGVKLEEAVHVAYSVKQFDSLELSTTTECFMACMVACTTDFALLELTELIPIYVSRDNVIGEEDCVLAFSIDYGDHYPEFEDIIDTVS